MRSKYPSRAGGIAKTGVEANTRFRGYDTMVLIEIAADVRGAAGS